MGNISKSGNEFDRVENLHGRVKKKKHTTPETISAKKLAADDELHETKLWLEAEEITQPSKR